MNNSNIIVDPLLKVKVSKKQQISSNASSSQDKSRPPRCMKLCLIFSSQFQIFKYLHYLLPKLLLEDEIQFYLLYDIVQFHHQAYLSADSKDKKIWFQLDLNQFIILFRIITMLPFYHHQVLQNPFLTPLPLVVFSYTPTYKPSYQNFNLISGIPILVNSQTFNNSPSLPTINCFLNQNMMGHAESDQLKHVSSIERINQTTQQSLQFSQKTKQRETKNSNLKVLPLKKQKYLKKNTQSNISNQVLSFLSCSKKSGKMLIQMCQQFNLNGTLVFNQFYSAMRLIKKNRKKYANKKMLLSMCLQNINNPLYQLLHKKNECESKAGLPILSKLVRILIRSFMDRHCPLSVFRSKKIQKQGRVQHLKRWRQIKQFLIKQINKV